MVSTLCVYSSSSDAVDGTYRDAAAGFGAAAAKRGYRLVFGAGARGLMGAMARSAHTNGGHITGVIPERLRVPGICYEECDDLIVSETMRERKAEMESRADAFVVLPGGFGTLEEFLEIITLKQLGYHEKPVAMYNVNDFFTPLLDMFEHLYRERFAKSDQRQLYYVGDSPESIFKHFDTYVPPVIDPRWYEAELENTP